MKILKLPKMRKEMEDAMKEVRAPLAYSEYLSINENFATSEPMSISDIVDELTVAGDAVSDEDVEDAVAGHATHTFTDAIVALDTLRRYASVHGCADSEKRIAAARKGTLTVKQLLKAPGRDYGTSFF